MIIKHNPLISFEIFLVGVSIFYGIPKLIIFIETFSDLSFGWSFNTGDFISTVNFFKMDCHHFSFTEIWDQILQKFFITICIDDSSSIFVLSLMFMDSSFNEIGRNGWLHEFKRKLCDPISFNILLYHPCKFYYLFTTFFLFVLNLSC